jgi:hypothetical protein
MEKINKQELIDSIEITEDEYNTHPNIVPFNNYIENVITDVEENFGTLEDAIFIIDDGCRNLLERKQIIETDESGDNWLVDICKYINNKETLIEYLDKNGCKYEVTEDGLWVSL